MSTRSFRSRYLLGLLCHTTIALVGCTGHPLSGIAAPAILASCGARPSFVSATELKRWDRFPVQVHIDDASLPETHREAYRRGIERGISLWAEATAGRIGTFALVDDDDQSPVHIALTGASLPEHAIGSTELTFTGNRIVRASVLLTRSRFESTPFLVNDVASTTAHEIGHVLGIVDHSPYAEDKMWVSGNFGAQNQGEDPGALLTARDVNTLQDAYCRR